MPQIARCDIFPVSIKLVKPFVLSAGTQNTYEGIVVRLESSGGNVGYGEAVPSRRVTGETAAGVLKELTLARKLILSLDMLETDKSLAELEKKIRGSSALAALDIALHDLRCRHYGIPLRRLLGGHRTEMETSVTITIRDEKETIRQAEQLLGQGFRCLKFKIGNDPDKDIVRVRQLRTWLGSGVKLRVDANCGYTVSSALRVLRGIYGCDIEFCEQPVPAGDLRALAKVRKASPVPIMADEAATDAVALLRIIKEKAADSVNLKLMKAGGLRGAFRMAQIAYDAEMPCQMGCFIETRIGITAAACLALAHPGIQYGDLDGHLELASDPCTGGVVTADGVNKVPDGPGLGIELRQQGSIFAVDKGRQVERRMKRAGNPTRGKQGGNEPGD